MSKKIEHTFEPEGDTPYNCLVCKHCTQQASRHLQGKWVIETNLGFVEGSIGKPIEPFFTEDIDEATYRDISEAKRWAGEIITDSNCGVVWVKLVSLEVEAKYNHKVEELKEKQL